MCQINRTLFKWYVEAQYVLFREAPDVMFREIDILPHPAPMILNLQKNI